MANSTLIALTTATTAEDSYIVYAVVDPEGTPSEVRLNLGLIRAANASLGHQHTSDDITDLTETGQALIQAVDASAGRSALAAAPVSHNHTLSELTSITAVGVSLVQAANADEARTVIAAAADDHQHDSTEITDFTVAANAAAAWAQTTIATGGTRAITNNDLREVLIYASVSALEIQLDNDLTSGFECVVATRSGAAAPTFVAVSGMTIEADGPSPYTAPTAPADVYIQRVATNTFRLLGLQPAKLSLDRLAQSSATDGQFAAWSSAAAAWVPQTGAAGVTDWLDLSDTPASYTGEAGSYARVSSGEAGWEFRTPAEVLADIGAQPQDGFLDDIAALTDPGGDRILFWDDSDGNIRFLSLGANVSINDVTLAAAAGGGGGGDIVPKPIYQAGSWINPPFHGAVASSVVAADRVYLTPLPVYATVTLTDLAVRVGTGAASTSALLGLYTFDGTDFTLVQKAASPISTVTLAIVVAALSADYVATPQVLWGGSLFSGGPMMMSWNPGTAAGGGFQRFAGANNPLANADFGSAAGVAALYRDQGYTSGLPSTIALSSVTRSNALPGSPLIFARIDT